MLQQIIKNNGATIDKNGKMVTLKTGYQVSKQDLGRIAVKDLTKQMIDDVVCYGLKRGEYCGVWIEDGFAYVDISQRISTKQEALRIGKERKQISVWQWNKQQCVYC